MASKLFRTGFNFYQNSNADTKSIKDGFLIRLNEYEIIIEDIRRNRMKGSVQHYLLLGGRGSGKSTLLKRLQVEIETDENLAKSYIVINLAEEQANIYKIHDLLEEILLELKHSIEDVKIPDWEEDGQVYARNLFAVIYKSVKQSGKKLILLLDNLDRIFDNLGDDTSLVREYLLNYNDIKIIGTSVRMTAHFSDYGHPFYGFFRVFELRSLTNDEIKRFLLGWGMKLDIPDLKTFIEDKPGQLETIHILTDGLPRTLQFFIDILLTNSQETGYGYLEAIMDHLTPLYQERLNNLPPSQRKIVLQMAFLWEAAGAKEIGEVTKMENRLISAQLKQLIDKGIAERVETSNKNNLYRVSERFFNLWLIFTQGRPDEKRKARYLTGFLENIYGEDEFEVLADKENKLQLSEQYYLPAKDKDYDISYELSKLYYKHNIKKEECLELLNECNDDDRLVALQLIVRVWNGIFDNLEKEFLLFIEKESLFSDYVLRHMIIHRQSSLVKKVLAIPRINRNIKERFLPVYYALQILVNSESNFMIKVPPEILETVNRIIQHIKEKQQFYYGIRH